MGACYAPDGWGLACVLAPGHAGPHKAPDGTTFEYVLEVDDDEASLWTAEDER